MMDLAAIGKQVGGAGALSAAVLYGAYNFAQEAKVEASEAKAVAQEIKTDNVVLQMIQVQQAAILKEVQADARANRELLIRVEAKLEGDK